MSKSKTIIVVCLAAAIVVIGVLVGVIIYLNNQNGGEVIIYNDAAGARGIVATPDNIDEIMSSMQEPVQDGSYAVKMNTNWVFPKGDKPSENAYVANSEQNTRTVYFDLILADTNQLLYSSPYIPVGAALQDFALDVSLEAGEHSAIVVYHLVDDDYQEITTVNVKVTLHIEK